MSAAISWNISREQMPQIVPTAGFSPSYCDYTAFTTDFDLSLLPESPECQQVPLSPCGPLLSLEDGLFDSFGYLPLKHGDDIKCEPADEPLHTPLKKSLSSGFFPDMELAKIEVKKEEPLIPTTVPSVKIKEEADAEVPSDHQLLRSVLKDTSFQRKFNIRPFDLPASKMAARPGIEDLESVVNLAFQQVARDIDNTCTALGIAKDPSQWQQEDVRAWLLWTVRQYNLVSINTDNFKLDGASLIQLSEEEFLQRSPESGSALNAHLIIWKAASEEIQGQIEYQTQQSPPQLSSNSSSAGEFSDEDEEEMDFSPAPATSIGSPSSSEAAGPSAGPSKRTSGAHIHLWQFLKELLSQPNQHGTCIRWLDRPNGVFKIEDSVRVAKLWGKRKNRPAMNYDKLSRSIRQYYKKGIMKKTERSQRLVYQFCHPYHL